MADVDPDVVKAFAGVALFAELSKRQVTSLVKAAQKVDHPPGREVAAQGRNGLAFHIVTGGEATVRVGDKVRRTLYPGDYFGEISMIDGQPRSATVTAGERGVTTYALNRTHFLSLVDGDSGIARAVMTALCGRIRAGESTS